MRRGLQSRWVERASATEDLRRGKERYPDGDELAPNRFVSHFFFKENSTIYRAANEMGVANDNFEFDLLDKLSERKDKK